MLSSKGSHKSLLQSTAAPSLPPTGTYMLDIGGARLLGGAGLGHCLVIVKLVKRGAQPSPRSMEYFAAKSWLMTALDSTVGTRTGFA